jgi:hypothetical protein
MTFDEIMKAELKVAIERFRTRNYDWERDGFSCPQLSRDAELLADAYVADLTARESAERERAEPITFTWLESIGFTPETVSRRHWIETEWFCIYVSKENIAVLNVKAKTSIVVGTVATTTRGMMLDFLNGLRVPHK